MRLGIVGSEAAKFTNRGEKEAREMISRLIERYRPQLVISGACHLGGIDIWTEEEAEQLETPFKAYPPEKRSWQYYKKRNIQIATAADVVICITVSKLPRTYKGMRFPLCYHCQTTDHVKSGGCWTVKYARRIGKIGHIITIEQEKT